MQQLSYTLRLDMRDTGIVNSGLRLKQGDAGMLLRVEVYNNGSSAYDMYATPTIVFRRPDGASVIDTMTPLNGVYEYVFKGNELQQPGKELVDVKFPLGDTGRESTLSCSFEVVPDTITPNSGGAGIYVNDLKTILDTVEADVTLIEGAVDTAQAAASTAETASGEATDAATSASGSASSASGSASSASSSAASAASSATSAASSATSAASSAALSKSWAVGPSGSGEAGTDTNNSKYWALQSLSNAQEVEQYLAMMRLMFGEIFLMTEDGDYIVTEDGDYIIIDY